MSTESIAWPSATAGSRPFVDTLHEWVTTVDHKRLGLLYIAYALVFLLIGGIEAIVMRIQLIRPAQRFRFATGFQPDVHDAWHDDDFLRGHACLVRIRQLPGPAHDWRAGHGFSAAECFQFLDDRIRWPASLLQPYRSQRPLWSGKRSRRGLVCLRTADFANVFA